MEFFNESEDPPSANMAFQPNPLHSKLYAIAGVVEHR
jgi:hypothetical protein